MPVVKHQLSRKDKKSVAEFQDVHKLDDFLAVISDCSPADEAEFAQEHFRGARGYFWGSAYRMLVESRVGLGDTRRDEGYGGTPQSAEASR